MQVVWFNARLKAIFESEILPSSKKQMLFYKAITSYTFLLLSYLERSVILWYIIKYDEKNNVKFFKLAKFKK